MDYFYKKSGNIFNAHSYWTKQPVNVVKSFIEQYTTEGETVLDPFSGTGMTGVAAIMAKRKYVLSDISPICLHIAKGYCTKYNVKEIEHSINALLSGLDEYYLTTCTNCGKKAPVNFSILIDHLKESGKLEIDRLVYNCSCCKNKQYKQPDENDYQLLNSTDYTQYFYPTDAFFGQEPKRNYVRGMYKVYQLYSGRNITVLSILWDRIQKINEANFKTLCEFAFTSILFNCSLMSRYSEKYENTKIKMGTFFIPYLIKDNNVIKSFRAKIQTILKANAEIFANNDAFGVIQNDNALYLSKVADNSIDYIYTDPPYSDVISYAELNIVYEGWLKERTDIKDEMIVSRAENKTIADYNESFKLFLLNAYRVLKDEKYITIIFHNANTEHWKAFQDALTSSPFTPVKSALPERLISQSKTSSQLTTGKKSQCFLAFTMKKSNNGEKTKLKHLSDLEYKELLSALTDEAESFGYVSESDKFDYIINRIIFEYKIM